jgi:uncharacterized protein YybS (DUF2232 family)
VRLKQALDLIRAAVTAAALFLAGGVVPVLGAPAMLCAPAPLLIYGLGTARSWPRIAAASAITLALVVLVAGPVQGLGFALSLGLGTILIAAMLRRQWRFEWIVVCAGAGMLTAATVALVVWAGSPAALARHLHDAIAVAMSNSAGLYEKLGISKAESAEISDQVLAVTAQMAPALGAMVAGLTVLLNLGLVARWLGKEKLGYQLFGALVTWRTPEWLIWLLLASGFGMFIPLAAVRVAAANGFVVVAAIYFCQGLAIMAYYLQMLAMPRIVRGTVYLIALLQPLLAALVCLAGVFDLWIDFRRLKPPSQAAGSIDDFF